MHKKISGHHIIPLGAIALTIAYSMGLLLNRPEWINGRNWEWVRRIPTGEGRLLWLAAIGLAALIIWAWAGRPQSLTRKQTAFLLAWAVIMTPLLQLAIAGQHRQRPWSVIFLNTTTSGFYQDGVRITEPTTFIREHLENMPSYRDVHVRTQPPGWQLAFWAANRLAERVPSLSEPVGRQLLRADCLAPDIRQLSPGQAAAAVLSLSILLWSGLGALPYWRLARYFLEERSRRLALIIYPFWPGLLVFTGRFDVLYAVLALFALWLAQKALVKGHWLPMVAFGLLMAAATWFGLGTLAIVGLVDVLLLAQLLLGTVACRSGFGRFLALNSIFLGALVALWGGLWLSLGVDGPALFALSQELHHKFRIIYPLWPLFNLFDLAVFMGIVTFCGALAGGVRVGERLVRRQSPRPVDGLIIGWLVVVLLLNLSGQIRAETGRLWLFLMGPGLLVGVAGWTNWLKVAVRPVTHQRRWELLLLSAFIGQALVTGLFLGGRAPESSVPEPVWRVADGVTAVSYNLSDQIALKGYTLHEKDGQTELTLYWQVLDFPRQDYAVFAHLLGPADTIVAQDDGSPQAGGLPTWCWVPGEVVEDKRLFPTIDSSQNGRFGIGLYNWQTGDRLSVEPAVKDNIILLPAELN